MIVKHSTQGIPFQDVLPFHVRIDLSSVEEGLINFSKFIIGIVYHPPEIAEPCNPSPCGANAICRERDGAGSCSCLPEYYGDPYSFCKPECISNSDCDKSRACFNQKCVDPCPGVCGSYADCHVVNHSPSCVCAPGYTGNPLSGCREPPKSKHFEFVEFVLLILMYYLHRRILSIC